MPPPRLSLLSGGGLSGGGLSVGEVAGRLGVTPSTVRMWGTRYGLTASARTAGGHRRYTDQDVERLERMHHSVMAGTSPAAAAAGLVQAATPARGPRRRGGPGGSVLAVPGAGPAVRGLARAASCLDGISVTRAVEQSLREKGTLETWEQLLRPVLVAAGEHWARTGAGIDIEHVLTQSVTVAFVRHVSRLPELAQESPILLAGAPGDEHALPLHAAAAALAERGVPSRFLGPRTPIPVIAEAARRTRAAAVLVWSTVPASDAAGGPASDAAVGLASIAAAHRRVTLLIAGPGWDGLPTEPAVRSVSLEAAVDLLEQAWVARSGVDVPS